MRRYKNQIKIGIAGVLLIQSTSALAILNLGKVFTGAKGVMDRVADTLIPKEIAKVNFREERIKRDLDIDTFVKILQVQYQLSDYSAAVLMKELTGNESALGRFTLTKALFENAEAFQAAEVQMAEMRNKTKQMVNDTTGALPSLEDLQKYYVALSPVVSALGPLLGSLLGYGGLSFVGILALNSFVEGTTENAQFKQIKTAFEIPIVRRTIQNKFNELITTPFENMGQAVGDVIGVDPIVTAKSVARYVWTGGAEAITFANDVKTQATGHTSEVLQKFSANLEISYVLAKMAKDWQKAGIPITQGITGAQETNQVVFQNAYHPSHIQNGKSYPFSFTFDASTGPIAITGDPGVGKTSALQMISLAAELIRIGSYLPAEEVVIPYDTVVTSLKLDANTEAQTLSLGEIIKAVDASKDQSILVLVDNPYAGTPQVLGRAYFNSFVKKLTALVRAGEPAHAVVFTTHDQHILDAVPQASIMHMAMDPTTKARTLVQGPSTEQGQIPLEDPFK